jgi:hypothetical protein
MLEIRKHIDDWFYILLLKRFWQLLIGLLVSGFFIYLIIPSLHLPEVIQVVGSARYGWILPGVAIYFAGLWARTWRWHYTLRHLKPVPLGRLFPLVCIGYFGNNVYPFRAGEVIRSYALKRKEDIPITSSLATVIIERVSDGLVMLLFVFLALPFAPMPPVYRNFVILLTLAMMAATAFFVWMATRPQRVARLYSWAVDYLLPARVRKHTDAFYWRFMDGLQSLSSGRDILMIFAASLVIWLMETVKYWFVMFAFDFRVTFLVLMLMNGLVNLATTLPSAPGYIGTFDTPGIEALAIFGVERNLAASYTFVLHAALWFPVTVVGAYYFWREQLHWNDFSTARQRMREYRP